MQGLTAAFLILASPALAHPGHDHVHEVAVSPFLAGLAHPAGGLDHLVAMVAVGLWAAVLGARSLWALPAAFVAAMTAGGALASAGFPLPDVEPVILGSVLALGAALALALRPPLALSLATVAVFGIAHGAGHGFEGPATGALAHSAGFVLATAALHLAGLAAGLGLVRAGRTAGPRMLGGAATAAGVVLLFG
jgi:urease accessory protein